MRATERVANSMSPPRARATYRLTSYIQLGKSL